MEKPDAPSNRPLSIASSPAGSSGLPRRAAAEELMRTCPNCGRELAERKCKLYCADPRCGYFLSCADYY